MVNYKIMSVDAPGMRMQVRYSKENKPDYFVNIGLDDDFDANTVHEKATEEVVQAERYWQRMDESFTLDTDIGECKDSVFVDTPDYDMNTQYVEENVTESNTTITYGWTVWDKSEDMYAADIRAKRDNLLKMTDEYAMADRTMTVEMIAYRQALRDVPNQNTFPTSVVWPIMPTN